MTERSPIDFTIAEKIGVSPGELSLERLEEAQLAEIRGLLSYLDRSRFYRERLRGIDPESIRTFEDFRRLPVTSETDLAGHENDFLCTNPGDVARMVTVPTTGTTGGRKRLAFSMNDIARSLEFIRVAYTTFMHTGDRMMVMMSGGTPGSIGDVVKRSMAEMGVETYIYGPITDLEDAYQAVKEWKPDVITGIPVQMAALARYGELKGGLRIREALLSADDVPDTICRRLRETWGARTFRHYGMTELCIFGGCECCADQGYHIRSSDIYFEALDPDENGCGEIAVTTFHHEAMPLLRYRTGDYGRIDRTVCGCGSPLPRLAGVRGRLSNSIETNSGRVFLRDIEEIIFAEPAVIDFECEIVQKGDALEASILLKHLPGDIPDTEHIRKSTAEVLGVSEESVTAATEESTGFAKVYNSKKRLLKQQL